MKMNIKWFLILKTKITKILKQTTAFQRQNFVFIFFLLMLLPSFFCFFNHFLKVSSLKSLDNQLDNIIDLINGKKTNQLIKNDFLETIRTSNDFYIDKNIESLTFLKNELHSLNTIYSNSFFQNCKTLKNRINYLTNENKIKFSETNRERVS